MNTIDNLQIELARQATRHAAIKTWLPLLPAAMVSAAERAMGAELPRLHRETVTKWAQTPAGKWFKKSFEREMPFLDVAYNAYFSVRTLSTLASHAGEQWTLPTWAGRFPTFDWDCTCGTRAFLQHPAYGVMLESRLETVNGVLFVRYTMVEG